MPRKDPARFPSSRTSASTSRSTYCCHDLPPSPPPHGRPTTWQQTRAPPTPLEADVPYSGLRKGGLLHKHSRQHATKTQCWSSCKDPPFPTPPACPPASTSATSTASTTCLPHLPPTLLPTPRPARLLSYSLPACQYVRRRVCRCSSHAPTRPPLRGSYRLDFTSSTRGLAFVAGAHFRVGLLGFAARVYGLSVGSIRWIYPLTHGNPRSVFRTRCLHLLVEVAWTEVSSSTPTGLPPLPPTVARSP